MRAAVSSARATPTRVIFMTSLVHETLGQRYALNVFDATSSPATGATVAPQDLGKRCSRERRHNCWLGVLQGAGKTPCVARHQGSTQPRGVTSTLRPGASEGKRLHTK